MNKQFILRAGGNGEALCSSIFIRLSTPFHNKDQLSHKIYHNIRYILFFPGQFTAGSGDGRFCSDISGNNGAVKSRPGCVGHPGRHTGQQAFMSYVVDVNTSDDQSISFYPTFSWVSSRWFSLPPWLWARPSWLRFSSHRPYEPPDSPPFGRLTF